MITATVTGLSAAIVTACFIALLLLGAWDYRRVCKRSDEERQKAGL